MGRDSERQRERTYFVSLQRQAVSFPCPRAFRLEASTTSQQKRCLLQEVEHSTTFFLNLGFPSYSDCKTFPQSLIQKLCKRRKVSFLCCHYLGSLPASMLVVPASPGRNNLFSSLVCCSFFLKSKH